MLRDHAVSSHRPSKVSQKRTRSARDVCAWVNAAASAFAL
jgi:hypothetical protein